MQIFKPSFTDRKTKELCESPTYHIRFRDHLNRRQRFVGSAEGMVRGNGTGEWYGGGNGTGGGMVRGGEWYGGGNGTGTQLD
jgi:hypothetical protein